MGLRGLIFGIILPVSVSVPLLSSCSEGLDYIGKEEIKQYVSNHEIIGDSFDFGIVTKDKVFTINFNADITKVPNEEYIVSVHSDATGSDESLINYETTVEKSESGYTLSVEPPRSLLNNGVVESSWVFGGDLYLVIWYSLIDSELIKYEKPIVVPFRVREEGEILR